MDRPYLFDLLIDLLDCIGISDLSQREEPLIIALDGSWMIAVHAQAGRKILFAPRDCMMVDADPFTFYIWYNGWFAGEIGYDSGWIADGASGNEGALRAAVEEFVRANV